MRHIIWRNRASAILGILVMFLGLYSGFPDVIGDTLIVLLGLLIALFGFYHGSGNYAFVEEVVEIKEKDIPKSKEKGHDGSSPSA